MQLPHWSQELPNDAESDTTEVDSSSERSQHKNNFPSSVSSHFSAVYSTVQTLNPAAFCEPFHNWHNCLFLHKSVELKTGDYENSILFAGWRYSFKLHL
jgi:hypothetical protein